MRADANRVGQVELGAWDAVGGTHAAEDAATEAAVVAAAQEGELLLAVVAGSAELVCEPVLLGDGRSGGSGGRGGFGGRFWCVCGGVAIVREETGQERGRGFVDTVDEAE